MEWRAKFLTQRTHWSSKFGEFLELLDIYAANTFIVFNLQKLCQSNSLFQDIIQFGCLFLVFANFEMVPCDERILIPKY